MLRQRAQTKLNYLNIQNKQNQTLEKQKLKQKHKLNDEQIVYIGDDLIDLPIMQKVAFPVSVSNATKEVKDISVYITNSCGGEGAFREVVEWVLHKKGKLKSTISALNKNVKKM